MNDICYIKSEIFLPKSLKPFFNIQQKIAGICRVVCVCFNVRVVWSSLDVWLLKAELHRRNNREQRLFFTYLFPKPALHLTVVSHIDPIVALPGESYVLTSNIRKRIGQSKMLIFSCHASLKTMNAF